MVFLRTVTIFAALAVCLAGCATDVARPVSATQYDSVPGALCADSADALMEALLDDLRAGDPSQKALARQLLPYYRLRPVPDLMVMSRAEDAETAQNAFNTLRDIANEACAPGRDADRDEITRLLMEMVGRRRPRAEQEIGLRLLERTVSPGYPVDPIADMLDGDPIMREKARATLVRIGTEPALAALRNTLLGAEPALQCAILNGLAEARDSKSLALIERMTKSPSPKVRAAAAHALAWSGDPAYVRPIETVIAKSDAATRPDAVRALIRLAQAIENRSRSPEEAKRIYESLLGRVEGAHREAVITGLGRTGDTDSACQILEVIDDTGVRTRYVALRALARIHGHEVTRAMLAAYTTASDADKPMFVLSLGARQDALALPELARAAAGRDTALRRAAYCALAESGLPDAIDVLVHAATIEPRKDSAVIAPNLLELARTAHARGNDAAAFKGYQALFALTDDTDLRLAALGGLADFPAAAGFEIAMEAARDEKLRPAAAGALAAAAAGCLAAGETARARQAFETLVRLDSSVGGLLSYASKVRSLGVEMDAAQLIGAIKTWWIVGPFTVDDLGRDWDTRFVGEPNIDLERVYDHGDNELAWRCVEGGGDLAMVNFIGHYGLRQSCFAYAYAAIEVPERQVAQLRLGTDDGVIAWVNGAKVHNHPVDRGLAPDNDIVPVRLEAGLNTILLRVSQGGGGWSFCARLTTQGGAPLESKQ